LIILQDIENDMGFDHIVNDLATLIKLNPSPSKIKFALDQKFSAYLIP